MRSNGKNIYEKDVECISYSQIGKFNYDFRVALKNGEEIKVKRSVGKMILEAHNKEAKK